MGSAVATFVGGGLMNALGSFVKYKTSENLVNKQIGAQSDENALNRDWQTQQAELARSYNTSEREAVQSWSEKMLNQQNDYNSPVNQALRLRSAGINSSIAMGSNGVTNISASPQGSSPGTSPMPSGVSGISPVSQQPLDLQIPQLMNGVGSFFKNIADAEKTGMDTSILSRTAESIIASAAADAQYKQTAADFLKIDKDIKDQIKDAEVASKWQELGILQGKLLITNSEAERQGLVTQLMKTQKDLNEILYQKHGAEYGLLMMDIASYNKKLDSLLKLQGSQASEASANASVLKEEKRIRAVAANIREGASANEMQSVIDDLIAKSAISEEQYAKALVEIKKIDKIRQTYDKHNSKLKVDATIENCLKILGVSFGVSAHN